MENLDDQSLEDLLVKIESDLGFLKPKSWHIDRIDPEGVVSVRSRDVDLDGRFLVGVREAVRGKLRISVEHGGAIIAEHSHAIELLAVNEWGGAGYMPELLAAFCMPNDPAIDKILHDASTILRRAGKTDAIDGYTSHSRIRVWEIVSAIYSAVANLGISYAVPPASFETNGQKIRVPSQILKARVATCLDTALLLAAAFEQAGLNPIIALLKDHALVGVWLQPEKLASVTNDEAEVLRKRFQLNELVLVEATLATSRPAPPFSRAVDRANDHLDAESDSHFVTAVDIARARSHRISPLGLRTKSDATLSGTDGQAETQLGLEEAPALPDFDEPVDDEKPQTPKGRIERWQRKLLDLSARNPLLNHRSTKSSVTLYCPDPGLLEDKLAAGSKISIVSAPTASSQEQDREIHVQRTGEQIDEAYARDALEQSQALVDLPRDELDKRMVGVYRKAQTSFQEGGANTLFLALGFLLWKRDERDARRFRAPLILLPVSLQRQSVRSGVKMLAHDDEPRFNTTLLEMLRKDFGIKIGGLDGVLPTDASGVDVTGVWNQVRRAVVDSPGFEVVEDVVLGHFSFAKYLMWKDLVDRTDELRNNPVVRHLIDSPRDPYESEVDFVQRDEIDRSFQPTDFLVPLPADSSQMASIASAERGKDFIIIGPPGTGKSQTISNLIAHLMGKGKTVLFVSEKTAALNVVYRRLEEVGLGRFCLELHSNKARKAEVLNQLKDAWARGLSQTADEWERQAEDLKNARDTLNEVVNRLHRRHANGLTAHHAIGVKVRDELLAQRVAFSWPSATQHSETDIKRMRDLVNLLQVQARAVGKVSDSPFQVIAHGQWSPSWQRGLRGHATELAAAAAQAAEACGNFCAATEIELPDKTLLRLEALWAFAGVLMQTYRKEAAFALEPTGLDQIEALQQSVDHLKVYASAQARLSCSYEPMAWRGLDGEELLERWERAQQCWFLKRFLEQRKVKKELQNGGAKGKPDPVIDMPLLIELRQAGEAIDALDQHLNMLREWKGHNSDPEAVQDMHTLADNVRTAVGRLAESPQSLVKLRTKVRYIVGNANDLLAPDAPIGRAAQQLQQALKRVQDAAAAFEARAGRSVRERFRETDRALEHLRETAEEIAERHQELNHWCNWQRRRNEACDADLAPLVEGIESGTVPIEEIPETFEAAYCTWWSERILEEDEILRTFSSAEHTDTIETFRELDTGFQRTTARYIAAILSAGLPREDDVSRSSQWGLVKREITKRAKHKPVRQLMEEAPEAITRLAPCLMMSPLSVAQYLAPDQSLFDTVIFDEASQITVWDAVGSIARGRQVIVAGDPKQMPPTNFFARVDDDEDGDVDYEGDLESILDELRSSNVPELTLNLHYRSRRESLIAFSNDRYYDNSLVTFPAPERPDRGVRLVQPEGFYDRGKSRTNGGEARAIVAEIVRRLNSSDPQVREKTIGVVSFNSEQQSLIQDLLDQERSNNPEIEWAFMEDITEPVFVKNLETVQGDERDVILFSVTYGPDRAGNIYMNFGPLNREGGERRMNVAMTRARSEMLVFSTLHPEKIDLSRTSAKAVADLKHFLEFAERGPDALGAAVHGSIGDFDSPFEGAVASGLRAKGWTVHPQIGVSAFRVDLGIVHPDHAGVYLAGVECDGAMYHSSAFARERDKIRQSVLEGLGWTLFRVWSTDWWISKSAELERLDERLRSLLEADRAKREETLEDESDAPAAGDEDKATQLGVEPEMATKGADSRGLDSSDEARLGERVASFAGSGSEAVTEVTTETVDARDHTADFGFAFRQSQPYVRAAIEIDTGGGQLGEIDPQRLVNSITKIVEQESPVHIDDVIRRVTHSAGLHRAGSRIQKVVTSAVAIAEKKKRLRRKREFLWSQERRPVVIRDRSELAPQEKKLERVAPEEIGFALLEAVKRNFSISEYDAITEAANDLGFQRVTGAMEKRIARVLGALQTKGLVILDGDRLTMPEK